MSQIDDQPSVKAGPPISHKSVEVAGGTGQRGLRSITSEIPGASLTRGRLSWPEQAHSDFACVRCGPDRLTLRDIDQRDPAPKRHMIGHLRFVKALSLGRGRPRILTWLRLPVDQPAAALFPGVSRVTEEGETLLSANSLVTYTLRELVARGWLHRRAGAWQVAAPASEAAWLRRGEAVVTWLQHEDRLHLYTGPWPAPADDDLAGVHPTEDVIPIDRLGFVRELVWHENPLAAFNTAFFLLEHNDFLSHHSGLGEPYNLFVAEGEIRRPPLYRRSALYQQHDGRWDIGMFGLADLELCAGDCPGALPWVVDEPGALTAYTRRWAIAGHDRVIGTTPVAPERHEFTIVDTRVVGYQPGGGLAIPQNGFVLSFAPEALSTAVRDVLMAGRVRYGFRDAHRAGMRQAVQAGPRLLAGGDVCLTDHSLADEAFRTDRILPDGRRELGVAPTDYPLNIDHTRAGRVGVGINRTGALLVTVIAGSEAGPVQDVRVDSAGATLVEMAQLMAEMGAVDAINMDGGGSSQLFFLSGLATVPGGRLGLQSVHYERMVPSVGVIR